MAGNDFILDINWEQIDIIIAISYKNFRFTKIFYRLILSLTTISAKIYSQ